MNKCNGTKMFTIRMLTSILPGPNFVPGVKVHSESKSKKKFKTAFTVESVFKDTDPPESDFILFFESRSGDDYKTLDQDVQTSWRDSWRLNRILCGYLVYAVVYPSYLKRRIKLRDAKDHWVLLDPKTVKGKSKLDDRNRCFKTIEKMTAFNCYKGTSTFIDPNVLVRTFLELPDDDEGVRFFRTKDFLPYTKNSSAHSSCSAILSHLWFVTTVLGRPCSLDSVVMPIRLHEASRLGTLGITGKIDRFPVDWKVDVFDKLPGYVHRNYVGLFLEKTTSGQYLDVYPSDAFLVYKYDSPVDILPSVKCGAHNTVVVPCFDSLLDKNGSCELDALDISSIAMEFGEEAALSVSTRCTVGIFSASLRRKMDETVKFFSEKHRIVRRFVKQRLKVVQSMDPGGVKKKLSAGRMLDPRVPENVKAVKDMIRQVSWNTWSPFKNLLFELVPGLSPDLDDSQMCKIFLGVDRCELAKRGVKKTDVANLCVTLSLTMSFHRSQILRDSTISEYRMSRLGGYILSLGREIKTSGADSNGYVASTEFQLTFSQSMMVHFIKLFGSTGEYLMVNERGSRMTQENLAAKYKILGRSWLGIPNMSPHVMRSFWTTSAVEEGLVNGRNMNEFAAYIQLSSKTLMTSYVAASTNNDSHRVGKRVMGSIMDAANSKRSKKVFDVEGRPNGKRLANTRNMVIEDVRATVSRYKNPSECFRALVDHRKENCLQKKDTWFEWENTFFKDDDLKFFVRFIGKNIDQP